MSGNSVPSSRVALQKTTKQMQEGGDACKINYRLPSLYGSLRAHPPPPTYILHPSPRSPCYICRHTTPSLLLPKQMLLKTNHSVKITVLPWQSCDDVNKLLRRDRGMTWLQSVFIVLCLYSNARVPSRSFSPLVVLSGLETCVRLQHVDSLGIIHSWCTDNMHFEVGRYWQHT